MKNKINVTIPKQSKMGKKLNALGLQDMNPEPPKWHSATDYAFGHLRKYLAKGKDEKKN